MTVGQAWLIFGVPALAFAVIAFVGRAWWRSLLGYLFLLGGFVGLVTVDAASGAVFALAIALLLAAGRGGRGESEPYDPTAGSRAWQHRPEEA